MNQERSLVYISGKISAETSRGVEANLNRMLDAGVGYTLDHPDTDIFLPGEANQRLGEALSWGWKDYMRADLTVLKKADTVYMVEGWKDSRGAKIEHRLAKMWGIPIEYEMQEGVNYELMLQ